MVGGHDHNVSLYGPRPRSLPEAGSVPFAQGVYILVNGAAGAGHYEPKVGTPPDLLFPQHTMQRGAELWEPVFFDYLYTSFTNATAFSPTDVMPLSRWAKLAMMVESALSLVLAILVIARAVNILD